MDEDLENIIEAHATALLKHLAVCIMTGWRLTQGEAKNLLRTHVRNAVMATEQVLLSRQAHTQTEKETSP